MRVRPASHSRRPTSTCSTAAASVTLVGGEFLNCRNQQSDTNGDRALVNIKVSGMQVELRIARAPIVHTKPYVRAGNIARVPGEIVAAPTLLDVGHRVSAERRRCGPANDFGDPVIVDDRRDAVGVSEFIAGASVGHEVGQLFLDDFRQNLPCGERRRPDRGLQLAMGRDDVGCVAGVNGAEDKLEEERLSPSLPMAIYSIIHNPRGEPHDIDRQLGPRRVSTRSEEGDQCHVGSR